jgi:site-specific recombinase XerD
VWVPKVSGTLAPFAAEFRSWLEAWGYSPSRVGHRLWQLDQFSRWLEREGVGVEELGVEHFERFVVARRSAGYASLASSRSMEVPLEFFAAAGVAVAPAPVVVDGPVEELLVAYRRYLLVERGLAEMTVYHCSRAASWFLEDRLEQTGGVLALERLTAGDVTGFLARECPRRSVSGASDLVSRLRSLLRYLHLAGLIEVPLVWAVPRVADMRDRTLARGLDRAVVKKLLASCDRRRTIGRRDYAILLLLVRFGLRSGEVAAIRLDDLDWRRGEILVRGKTGRDERLPLPVDVGEAIVSYLHRRPRVQSRALFLRAVAPFHGLSSDAIAGVVGAACARAGVPPVTPHPLRHTAATEMLRRGASLVEIAQVLRHREVKTTAIYAKVDRKALRTIAQPWPGGQS